MSLATLYAQTFQLHPSNRTRAEATAGVRAVPAGWGSACPFGGVIGKADSVTRGREDRTDGGYLTSTPGEFGSATRIPGNLDRAIHSSIPMGLMALSMA